MSWDRPFDSPIPLFDIDYLEPDFTFGKVWGSRQVVPDYGEDS
jgi:hypothetical protein